MLELGRQPFAFSAGQAVMVGLHGSPLRKPYSIASAPVEVQRNGVLQLLLQVDDSGALDPHLELAAPGTRLDVEGPFGTFGLPEGVDDPILMVAGGTGIAPLRSILIERLSRGPAPKIAVVYSARSPEEVAFRSELETLQREGKLSAYFTVTREGGDWKGRRGRIDETLLREALPSPRCYGLLCGPPALVAGAAAILRSLGVDDDRIRTENY